MTPGQVKRRNDPTSAKVSNILGSYDKAKELVTSSRMIGAILQPPTPRPSVTPPATTSRCQSVMSALRPELSRQGVFEQFQRSSEMRAGDAAAAAGDTVSRAKTPVSCTSSSSSSVANGRHKSIAASSAGSKHDRLKLAIPRPKVCWPSSVIIACIVCNSKQAT